MCPLDEGRADRCSAASVFSACARSKAIGVTWLHVLIDQNRVPIWINGDETGRPRCALVCLLVQLNPLALYLALQRADVGEHAELPSVAVPAGIKSEDVLLEHALKQPYRVIAVLHDQPVLRRVAGKNLETELLVESLGSLQILDSQA